MKKKIVTFGEVLLRWSKNGRRRLSQGSQFNGNYGGSEANVAVSLATLGDDVEYVTRVPDNIIGRACCNELRYYGLNLDHVVKGGDRLGTYYFEEAAAMRNSCVVYDRNDSSFNSIKPGVIDWRTVFSDVDIFHCSGITCAVSQSAADATFEAVRIAKEMGLTICCDINYRKNLWKYGADAHEMSYQLMQYSDFVFGDQGEYDVATGLPRVPFDPTTSDAVVDEAAYLEYFAKVQAMFPHCHQFLMAVRNQMTSTHHTITGLLYTEGKLYTTRIYDVQMIVDPMGVGDAFVAAYIHAALKWPSDFQQQLNFSLAASALKNSVPGDFNLCSEDEIMSMMDQPSGGRIDR
jgi:2-dehydro-3-deoxygluconokinase